MQLESLDVQSFRNLRGGIVCGRGLNILVGENGQGKTNWLEAIGVLASTRSFRTAKLQEALNFGENEAFVHGNVRESPEIVHELRVIGETPRPLLVNDKKKRSNAILASFTRSCSTPTSLRSSAANRRPPPFLTPALRLCIRHLSKSWPTTIVIKQKNALLQNAREIGQTLEKTADLLEPWNEQLAARNQDP